MIDIWQGIFTGFCSGLGTGLANWIIIKRLDHIENKIKGGLKDGRHNKV